MSEWNTECLKHVINFNPRENMQRNIKAKKIAMEKIKPFSRFIEEYEFSEFRGGTKFRNGDTLLARITPCLENGKTAQVDILDNNEVGFGSTEFIVLREKSGISDNDFIYYMATTDNFRKIAIQSMVGSSGRQRVQQDVLENSKMAIPSFAEQKAIAKTLSCFDEKIRLNNRINNNLEQQAKALYDSMFVINADDSWPVGTLADIANITMGQSPNGTSYNEDRNGEIFFQGRAEFGDRFPTIRLYTTEPKRMAERGDVLMSVRAPVGDFNVAYERCCIGRGLAAIHSKDAAQSFLLYTMFSLQHQLNVFNGEGTVFGSINRDALNTMPIVIPDKDTIKQFERAVKPIDALIENYYSENRRLRSIRDALLPKLMSGEIDISGAIL